MGKKEEEGRDEGREGGREGRREEGREEGREGGREEGREEGRESGVSRREGLMGGEGEKEICLILEMHKLQVFI